MLISEGMPRTGTWRNVVAELFLVSHALLQEFVAKADVVGILNLLPEQLFLALPRHLTRVRPLQASNPMDHI